MKAISNNRLAKTNFAKHDQLIRQGESTAFDGWLNAGVECYERHNGNASAYAKSAVSLRWTGKNTLTQSEATIRIYVGAVVTLMRKHGSRAKLVKAYDAVYESREISALRNLATGNGQRKANKTKKSKQDTVALTKRKASAFVSKFVPANKRDEAMESLGF